MAIFMNTITFIWPNFQLVSLQHQSSRCRRTVDGKWEGWKLFIKGKHIKSRGIFSFCEVRILRNRFHVAVRLFSNRSQMTSKCGKNKKVAHKVQPSVSLMFLPHFDVLCDLLLNRRTATWNLFVLYNKKLKYMEKNAFLFQFSTLTDTKIAVTWSYVYTKWNKLIGCYA